MKLRNFFCASSQSNLLGWLRTHHHIVNVPLRQPHILKPNKRKGRNKKYLIARLSCVATLPPRLISFYFKGTDHTTHIAETSLSFDPQSIKSLSLSLLYPLCTHGIHHHPLHYINHHTSSIRTRTVTTPQNNHLSSMLLPTETPRLLLTIL